MMKKTILTIMSTALLVVGCKNNAEKEANAEDTNNTGVESQSTTVDPDEMRYADASLEQQEYAVDFNEFEEMNIAVDDKTRTEVESWNELNTINATILDLEEAPEAEIPDYTARLKTEAEGLKSSIPTSLLTEEVEEDIKDINEEVIDLEKVIAEADGNQNKISRQVEELLEAYDDLDEEIKETIKQKSEKKAKEAEKMNSKQ